MRSLIALLLVPAALSAQAATFAVGPSSTGNGSGSDWNNRAAWSTIAKTRGNTYCIMEGNYGSPALTTAQSGTSTITIKKATTGATECTSLGGWSTGLGDAQAVFGDIGVGSPYWIIDGVTRNESNWKDHAAYGIQVTAFYAPASGGGVPCTADNVTVRYVHVGTETTSFATSSGGRSFLFNPFAGGASSCQNWTVSRVLIQNTQEFQCAGGEGLIVEYTYFYIVWSKEAIRGQVWCKNAIVRWNVFEDACQDPGTGDVCTADIGVWDGGATAFDNWEVYGNVFFRTDLQTNSQSVIFIGFGAPPGPLSANNKVYNNTIVGYRNWNADIELNGSNNDCYNNLWYDNTGSATGCNAPGANNRVVSSDPFVNYAVRDFRLIGAQTPGTTLSAPYNTDMKGVIRGASGWDIGALEFGGSPTQQLAAPANLRVLP